MEQTMLIFGGRGTSTQVSLLMRALYSSHIVCFQLGSCRAWKADLGMREEMVTWKLYLRLAFTIPTLECVTIGCCEVDGDGGGGEVFGGGVFGGSVVFSGDGVGNGVKGVVCGVVCSVVYGGVKAPISMMIVRVPEKDRWCGTRGKFVRDVIVDRGGGEDIKHGTSVECFVYYKTQGHVMTGFELHCHRDDQDVDAKWNDYYETIGIKIGAFIISGEFTYRNKVFNYIGCDKNIFKVEWAIWIRDLYMSRVGDRYR
ncbi:hypothetical protein Tco_0316383 [Tanacetum coccineum]